MTWALLVAAVLAADDRATELLETERLAASALLCSDAKAKADALAEIRTEQRYARQGGGVVDMEKIHAQQVFMRGADKNAAEVREWLSRHRLSALSCKDRQVRTVAACIAWAMYESDGVPFWEMKNEASCSAASTVMEIYRTTDD